MVLTRHFLLLESHVSYLGDNGCLPLKQTTRVEALSMTINYEIWLSGCTTRYKAYQNQRNKQKRVGNRAFSLTWSVSMLIYWNKRKFLHKKRVQLPQDWFGTPTWPPFHCFGTPIWPPLRHVKTLYFVASNRSPYFSNANHYFLDFTTWIFGVPMYMWVYQ